jgi:hypothetical protein
MPGSPRSSSGSTAILLISLACWCVAGVMRPATADAQRLDRRDPSYIYGDDAGVLSYTIDAQPRGSRLDLRGRNRLAGPAPLRIPADSRGRYVLEATAPGHETQRGLLELPGGGDPLALHGPHHGLGAGRLTLALVWPGVAALREGDRLRGAGWFLSAAIGASGALGAHVVLQGAIDDADLARRDVQAAHGTETLRRAQIDLVRQETRVERLRNTRRDWLVVTGLVWGASAVDYFLLSPTLGRHEVALTEATVMLRPMSRTRALLYSLLPGQGQLYARRPRAAALSIFGTLGAGVGLLLAERSYDEAVDRVAGLAALYDDPAADPESLSILRPAVEDAIRHADSRRSTRNALLGVTVGVWALGLLDAYLGTPEAVVERPFGGRVDQHRPSLGPMVGAGPAGTWQAGARLAF